MKKYKLPLLVVAGVVLLAIVALVIYAVTQFKTYQISGSTMTPTLTNGEKVLATKQVVDLKRGDIVFFREKGSLTIERIIGLPGDRVVIQNGSVTIYNSVNPHGFNPDSGQSYITKGEKTPGNINQVVPANEYFVLGDNRLDAMDSRVFGPIPNSSIVAEELRPLNSR